MTFPEGEFYDVITLARMFDTSKDIIRETYKTLVNHGHEIEALNWGQQGKLKIHYKQFRTALLREYRA